jgi:aspartyl/asparaginyl-tRNA synthetase
MFEFESHGNMDNLITMEKELLGFLGFGDDFKEVAYEDASQKYNKLDDELGYDEEAALCKDFGDVTFLTDFPLRTHPFWNMKYGGSGLWNKVDVIMHGQETIGSAERAVNVDEMREQFHTISNGEYAGLLYNHFGKKRVEDELEEYLKHDFFPRFGGGIGLTRMVRAMEMSGLLK